MSPEPGSTWTSRTPGSEDHTIRVLEIDHAGEYALCEVLTNGTRDQKLIDSGNDHVLDRRGHHIRVPLGDFSPRLRRRGFREVPSTSSPSPADAQPLRGRRD